MQIDKPAFRRGNQIMIGPEEVGCNFHKDVERRSVWPMFIETTWYDLIAALQDETEVDDDATVIAAAAHLVRTGRIRRPVRVAISD